MSERNKEKPAFFAHVGDDARAGLVVFLIALPLCLGIALASGAPLFAGLVSGIVGGLVVGYLSGSPLSISGPAAGLTVIVLGGIAKIGSFEGFLLAVVIAGVLQLGLGFARAGFISLYFPTAVIKGMLVAIGLTLVLKQIPHALGDDRDAEGEFEFFQLDGRNTLTEIANAVGDPSFGAIVIFTVAMAIMLTWDKLHRINRVFEFIPASLIAAISGVLMNLALARYFPQFALEQIHLVSLPVVREFSEFAGLIRLPDFTQFNNPQIYLTAFTIAIVASLETLLNIEATDKIDPHKRRTPANRELKAQGVGNIISGLLGGIPVTSVIVRSSANINAGGKTKLSSIIHGVLLLVSILFFARAMNLIPLAALAAILIIVGYKLAKPAIFKAMYQLGWTQFLPFMVTIVAVLFTDLLIGIGIGMVVGVYFILKENFKTAYFFSKETKKENEYIRIDLSEHVSFLNKASIANILDNLPENSTVEIDGTKSSFIDYDVLEVINNFGETAKLKNITLRFESGINEEYSMKTGKADPPALPETDTTYRILLENNRQWVADKLNLDPEYFHDLAKGQSPKFLFIGCSDSRVQPSEITGTEPGEMFIHRNVANLVINTDLNFMSVLQYAVEVLKVEHIIVCGHYGCGGVKASMDNHYHGLIDKWLRSIKDIYRLHRDELKAIRNEDDRFQRLVELNIIEQVYNLHKTSIIQRAWHQDANVHVHGWVYDIKEGLIRDLNVRAEDAFDGYDDIYKIDFAD